MNALLRAERFESEAERELCTLAYELHQDEGAPAPMTYARAAESLFGWETISDEPARDRLRAVGVCPDCYALDGDRHAGCVS